MTSELAGSDIKMKDSVIDELLLVSFLSYLISLKVKKHKNLIKKNMKIYLSI